MQTKRTLRTSLALFLFGAVPVVAACGGQVIPLGTNQSQLRSVNPQDVSGSCGACPAGYAHPNVCCETNADSEATCGAWVEHPFQACEPGWQTYPNPLSCCSLSNDKDCIDTPADAGPVAQPPSYGCGYACPPGWYSPPGDSPVNGSGSCCQVRSDGSTECFGWASAAPTPVATGSGGSSVACLPPQPVDAGAPETDAGPAPDAGANGARRVNKKKHASSGGATIDAGPPVDGGPFDGGVDDGGIVDAGYPDCGPIDDDGGVVTLPPGYDGGVYSLCGECPTGWSPDPADPALCCRYDGYGITECFSQASGPIGSGGGYGGSDGGVIVEPSDAGVSVPPTTTADASAGTGGGCSGTSSSCSCESTTSGHDDVLDCTVDVSGTTTCFCEQDGQSTQQFTLAGACGSMSTLQSAFQTCFGTTP